jgi:hypothetical protein
MVVYIRNISEEHEMKENMLTHYGNERRRIEEGHLV